VSPAENKFLSYLSCLLIDDAIDRCDKMKKDGKNVTLDIFLQQCDVSFHGLHNLLDAKFKTSFETSASTHLTAVMKRMEEKKKNILSGNENPN
jgi:hypothetical protein